jgi:hypothetical protein
MTRSNQSINQDEWLADFTDQILDGEGNNDLPTPGSDPEMRDLAETLLRLKNAFSKENPDPVLVKRMQAKVLEHWRHEQQKKTRWSSLLQIGWLTQSRRQQFRMVFAVIAIVVVLILAIPFLFTSGGPITASAGSEMSDAFLWIALVVLVGSIVWLLRRRP